MTRGLAAVSWTTPVWESGGVRVEGPDEDAFTLAVDALERLGLSAEDRAALDRLDLVGAFPAESEWGILEAIGAEGAEVRRHPSEVVALVEAVSDAATREPAHRSVVVAVDVARGPGPGPPGRAGAAAAAFLLEGSGAAKVTGRAVRAHPPERRPDAQAWVRAAERASPGTTEATRGRLALVADTAPPVLLARWKAAYPLVAPTVEPWELPGRGVLPLGRMALALHAHLPALAAGERLFVATVRRERTEFLAVEAGRPVRWCGSWELAPGRIRSRARAGDDGTSLAAVSEGAYVPRPRYLENLPSRWRFQADRCGRCARLTFPRRGYCRHCRASDGLATVELPHDGIEVEAVTTVGPGAQPTEFDGHVAAQGPYAVVLARLADDARATLQVTDADPSAVHVGDRMSTRLRRLYPMEGAWRYGRKAVPGPGAERTESGAGGGAGSQGASTQPA